MADNPLPEVALDEVEPVLVFCFGFVFQTLFKLKTKTVQEHLGKFLNVSGTPRQVE